MPVDAAEVLDVDAPPLEEPPAQFDLPARHIATCGTPAALAARCGMDEEEFERLGAAMGDCESFLDWAGIRSAHFQSLLEQAPGFPPRLVSRATRFHRACCIKCNFSNVLTGAPPRREAAPDPVRAGRKVKLSTLVDGTLEADLVPLPTTTVHDLFARYARERGALPHEDHEPTPDQLAAVQQLLASDVPPYVDFSIFGPHGKRMQHKLHLVAQQFNPQDGSWQRLDLPGPPGFSDWWRCWLVFRCTMLLLNAAKAEPLDLYGEHIRTLATTYGPQAWFLIYQADVRMRREHLERIRRRAALAPGPIDPPTWSEVFHEAVQDQAFWNAEVRDRALLYLARVKSRAEIQDDGTAQPWIQGDAKAGYSSQGGGKRNWARQRSQRTTPYTPPPSVPPPIGAAPAAAPAATPAVQEYCNNWNAGRCVPRGPCPQGRLHRCSLCGGAEAPQGHIRSQCPRNPNPPSRGVGDKGKGKGRGRGPKGRGRGRG